MGLDRWEGFGKEESSLNNKTSPCYPKRKGDLPLSSSPKIVSGLQLVLG